MCLSLGWETADEPADGLLRVTLMTSFLTSCLCSSFGAYPPAPVRVTFSNPKLELNPVLTGAGATPETATCAAAISSTLSLMWLPYSKRSRDAKFLHGF